MPYNQKLEDERKQYGAVTCSVCKKRTCKDWNIYSVNTICSQECRLTRIEELLSEADEHIARAEAGSA